MNNEFIELITIDDNRMALDLDTIKGYIEQTNTLYTKEGDSKQYVAPDHCLVVTSILGNIRIKETYDTFEKRFDNALLKRNLNI